MKFRAISNSLDQIQVILRSLQAATKLTGNVVFCLSESCMQIIADPTYKNGPLLSRCKLSKENLFDEYQFSGVNQEYNIIYFDAKCDSLSNVLRSLPNNIKSLKLKLANGQDRRFKLVITVEYPSIDSSRFIEHYVYVSIMNRKYWSVFNEQPVEPIQISFYLPNFKEIASTIERLASLAQYAKIFGKYQQDEKACFNIGLCNESISIKSKFSKLDMCELVNEPSLEPENDQSYKICIDIRKLSQVFNAVSLMKPSTTSCSISHENAVCFHFFHELASFKVILPHYDE